MENWRKIVIETLGDIVDVEAQRESWIRGAGRPIPDPDELVCQLFDDSGLWVRLSGGIVFSSECDRLLYQLGQLFDSYSLDGPPATVLAGSEWRAVVDLAGASLACINALPPAPQ